MPRFTIFALLGAVLLIIGCSSSDDTPTAPVVPSPSNLRATILSYTSIRLNWEDNSFNEAGFRVERAPAGGDNFARILDVPANVETYTDTGLTEGSVFKYRISSFSGATVSPCDPLPVAVPLMTPTDFTGERLSTTSIGLNWTDASGNETGYQVEMKIRNVGDFELIGELAADVESYVAEGLTPRTFYQFRIRAVKDTVGSAWSSVVTKETTVLTPMPPTELAASTNPSRPNAVSLSWFDNSSNEYGFIVEASLAENFGWEPIDTTHEDQGNVVIRGLTAETVYFFRIYAFNGAGASEYSNVVSIEVPGVPVAPSGLSLNAPDWRGVDIRWTDNSRNEEGFYIERRQMPVGGWQRIATTIPDTTLHFDGTVTMNVTYRYRIQAFNDAGTSDYCEEVEITMPDGPPAAPISLGGNAVDIDKIIIAWNDLANNETNYFVERKLHEAAEFEMIGVYPENTNMVTDTGLTPETSYDYRVYCVNGYGQSAYSNVATARTQSLTVFYDGFENALSNDAPPAPWVTQTAGTSYAIVTNQRAHEGGSKSLLFHDPDVGENTALVYRSGFSVRRASMHAWLYIPASSHFGVIAGDASPDQYVTWQVQFNEDNTFFVRDGAGLVDPGGTYPLNQWFEMEVAFSTDSSKYQVFFNGEAVTDTLNLQRTDHTPNGAIYLIAFSDQELYDGYVDDIDFTRFYQPHGSAPRRVVPPMTRPIYVGRGVERAQDALRAPFKPGQR